MLTLTLAHINFFHHPPPAHIIFMKNYMRHKIALRNVILPNVVFFISYINRVLLQFESVQGQTPSMW